MNNKIKVCNRCIMDSTVPHIQFDESGECNYCKIHDSLESQYPRGQESEKRLNAIVDKIKKEGKNKKYDCIVGISGGVDSSYTLYLSIKLGLRPLAVTYDNHWGTKISEDNINNLTRKLNVDLSVYNEDWDEFRDLELAFLRASTPDVEILSDERIKYALNKAAEDEKVKYIINGHTFRVEGKIPPLWSYGDSKYIKSLHKQFGEKQLKTIKFPGLYSKMYDNFIGRIRTVRILDYVDFSKEKAKEILQKEVGWKDYGGHHYESIITRYCYGYLLPIKFGIDKRITHLSANLRSGYISREMALEEYSKKPLSEEQRLEDEKAIIKKLDISPNEFKRLFEKEPKSFMDYPNNYKIIYRFRKPLKFFYEKFYGQVPYTLSLMEHTDG